MRKMDRGARAWMCAATAGIIGVLLPALAGAATPKASSEASNSDGVHFTAARAFDGMLSTSWGEGEMGQGEGAWLELRLDRPTDIASVSIWPGWLSGTNREIREYARPRVLILTFEVANGEPVEARAVVLDPGEAGPLRHDVTVDVPAARSVRLTVEEAYGGGIHSDLHIAEVALNLVGGAADPTVDKVGEWLASEAGQSEAQEQKADAIALFDKIKAEQFGDRDSMRQLMDWAADGAPFLRTRVARSVPAGFRVAALQPDKTSIEALLKLKDSVGIPAIERAALRSTGRLQADLNRRAKMFSAHQDTLTTSRSVAPWGQTGVPKGALQSMGEPLDIQVDDYGGVWIADVANHRVQKFGIDTGVAEQVWGHAERGITELWFHKARNHYASGSLPSKADGFAHPVDLEIVHGKRGDSALVLDLGVDEVGHKGTWGRLSVIDPSGAVSHAVPLGFDSAISGGVGGEGHVVVAGKNAVVIWGNEGAAYSLRDWSEVSRFSLADGVPNGAVGFKNGKLGLVYGEQLVLYGIDGFRHGDLLLGALGKGFQDWSPAMDERGKLWAVIDNGDVVKFKKPGRVEFRFQLAPAGLAFPRIAVYDDHVFVTARDSVLRGDAQQMLADQAAGESRENIDLGE